MQNKAKVIRNGGSLYIKIEPYFVKRGMVQAGDWVDFEIKKVERSQVQEDEPGRIRTGDVVTPDEVLRLVKLREVSFPPKEGEAIIIEY